jgi:hypothetical protein
MLCLFPGEIAEGHGTRPIIVDEKADESQRRALETIIRTLASASNDRFCHSALVDTFS